PSRKPVSVSHFEDQTGRYLDELREAREQQAASAEILKVINSSRGNLAPIFDVILEKAHSLCHVPCGSLQLYDGEQVRAVAVRGMTEAFEKVPRAHTRWKRGPRTGKAWSYPSPVVAVDAHFPMRLQRSEITF